MVKTDLNDFITWNGASCIEEPPIWTSGATALEEEATGLVIGAILTVNSIEQMERRKKGRSFSWVLKLWTQSSNEEEKSLIMTLERLLSFYRCSNRPRYVACISRPIVARRMATRSERGPRVLKRTGSLQAPQDTWQHTWNVNLVFNRVASL